jgi:hypothetical protein
VATTFTFDTLAAEMRKEGMLAKDAVKVIRKTVKLVGPRAVQDEISSLTRAPVDRGTYRRSFRFEDVKDGATAYNFAPYAPIIEYGRAPGARMPPVQAIYEWVKRKGIGDSIIGPIQRSRRGDQKRIGGVATRRSDRGHAVDKQQWGIALAIARKIKARGLPAYLVLERAAGVIDDAIRAEIDRLLEGASA